MEDPLFFSTSSHCLPDELVSREILPRLPFKSLVRFKCVSKKWYSFIADETFLSSSYLRHRGGGSEIILADSCVLDQSKTLLILSSTKDAVEAENDISFCLPDLGFDESNEIHLLGSCEGLILLVRISNTAEENATILCNPATREARVLPTPTQRPSDDCGDSFDNRTLTCLGFDHKRDEHKVVKILGTRLAQDRVLNFQVLSKNSKSWTTLKPFFGYSILACSNPAVTLDGNLYFLASSPGNSVTTMQVCVLSFDFSGDKIRHIVDIPPYGSAVYDTYYNFNYVLTKWKENSLGLVVYKSLSNEVFDFWVMKKDRSWAKQFEVDFSDLNSVMIDVRGAWKDQLLLRRWWPWNRVEFFLYNPVTGEREDVAIETWFRFSFAYDYVTSLISVHPRKNYDMV